MPRIALGFVVFFEAVQVMRRFWTVSAALCKLTFKLGRGEQRRPI